MTPEELENTFPNLKPDYYLIASPSTPRYNCFVWAAGDDRHWWEPIRHIPGYYWPRRAPLTYTLDSYTTVFQMHGFVVCDNGDPEAGYDKIAIYADATGEPKHAARQLESGQWISKLGSDEDIVHATLAALEGEEYGTVVRFMRRRRESG